MAIYVLSGPPCAGKTTLALHLAQPSDVVLDFDRICRQLGSPNRYNHPRHIRQRAAEQMDMRIALLQVQPNNGDAYVIRWAPKPEDRERYAERLKATVWLLNPGMDECVRRAHLDNRPGYTINAIRKWYGLYQPSPIDQTPPPAAPTVTHRD